jgi:NAD(P)-dependent dehydrogenase (short-subunit alcohol dehydrogenase family)
MSKVWFVTGSSRGLGRALTESVLAAGHQVIASARKPEQLADLVKTHGNRVRTVKLDVTSPDDANKAAAAAVEAFGHIDVVVNNAGYGFLGAFEEMTPDEFKAQIDTNFWGVVNVTRAVVPTLRKQGFGHIIQITSVGGRIAVTGFSGYHAAKYAVEGLSESLAQELKPLGIKVTIVEPGGFRTDWAGASMAYAKTIPAYVPMVGKLRGLLENHTGHEPGDPRKGAAAIMKITDLAEPPLRLPLGNDAMAFLSNGYKTSVNELERWSELTRSTDFDGAPVSVTVDQLLELASS